MEDWPLPFSYPFPVDNYHVVVYSQASEAFKIWNNAQSFPKVSRDTFGEDFTNQLSQSVGCLLVRENGSFRFLATAFVVCHFQAPSDFVLPQDANHPNRRPVKALLLTAAHVFTSPFNTNADPRDIFFTLSPTVEATELTSYSKFRVKRVVNFEPSFKDADAQIDPLLGYPYMLPQDVDVLAILENDNNHIMSTQGNVLESLPFQDWNNASAQRDCVIVGYPGLLDNTKVYFWAPIIGKIPGLKQTAEGLNRSDVPTRAFSVGRVLSSNSTCIAVDCSTGAGMPGSPICVLSANTQTLAFCGVYNGSAAIPFQGLLSKILFRLQGKPVDFGVHDLPRMPAKDSIGEHLLWARTLCGILEPFTQEYSSPTILALKLGEEVRAFLFKAEKCGINVEHNLGVCGGDRFKNIMEGLRTMNLNRQPNVETTINFNGMTAFNENDVPFTERQLERNERIFFHHGTQGKSTKFLFFTKDAAVLSQKLKTSITKFAMNVESNCEHLSAQEVKKVFVKEIWNKFVPIFEMWISALNHLIQ